MDHTRHIDIFPAFQGRITLIGAGGIGSVTAIALAKMSDGTMDIFDGDLVEEVNVATQAHNTLNIGRNKADAIAELCDFQSGSCDVQSIEMRFPENDKHSMRPSEFVISAVDSIDARKAIWEDLKQRTGKYYLDARMSAEVFQLYVVDHKDDGWYDSILASQNENEIPDIACTAKATFYTACIAAGHIGKTVRMLLTGMTPPKFLEHDIVRDRITTAYKFA